MYASSSAAVLGDGYTHFIQTNSQDGSHASWSSLVGIITAIVGNILISFALNIQRYAHIRIDREYNQGQERTKPREGLPKSLRKYGTAVEQEEAAEERAKINATASGPGETEENERDARTNGHSASRRGSFSTDETAKPQKRSDNEGEQDPGRKSYLRSPYWWAGIILMTIGEAGNFLAYGFAPASIVSPLGVVALVSNCLIAPLLLKERFRKRDFWGVVIAIGGAVTVVLSAKTSETKMGPSDLWHAIKRWEFLTYIGITCVFISVLMFASPRYGRRTILIDLGLVGLFGGYTALSTKGVASMLSGSLWRALAFPITYALVAVLVLSAVMQIRYINRALSNFDSTQVIPTQFVLFTLSVIIGSAVLYRDFEKTDLDHVIKFVVGCLLTFSGVYLITSGRQNDDNGSEEGDNDETIRLIDEEAETTDERTPLKREHLPTIDTKGEMPKLMQRHSINEVPRLQPESAHVVPSVSVTPDGDGPDRDPWTSSADHSDRFARPNTPPNLRRMTDDDDDIPVYTPSTVETVQGRAGLLTRTDSSPADPQTPSRAAMTPGPPKPDTPQPLPAGEMLQTPQSNIFRSARGSISRLLPGPFITPLSSSLSAVVADSLLKGEGSPQGPIRSRSYRRERSYQNTSSPNDARRRSTTALLEHGIPDLESGLNGPSMSRWHTRDSIPEGHGDSGQGPDAPREGQSSLLPSFSPKPTRTTSKVKDRGKDPEHDESGEEPTNTDSEASERK